MMSEKTSNRKSLVLWLIAALLLVLALVMYLGRDSDAPQGPIDTPVVQPIEPVSPEVPSEPIEPIEPSEPDVDPVEKAKAIIGQQSVSMQGLEIGMESGEAINLIEALMKPETQDGNQSYSMRLTPETANGFTLLAVSDNILDDSVKAQEVTAIFTPGQRVAFVLSEYSVRVKCYRNANEEAWQTNACR